MAAGYTRVTEGSIYRRDLGYGFETGNHVWCLDRRGKDALHSDFCTSDKPFYFSVALPEGNYKVTLTLGDQSAASVTTVKADGYGVNAPELLEQQRLSLHHGQRGQRSQITQTQNR